MEVLPDASASSLVRSLLIALGIAEAFVNPLANEDIFQRSEAAETSSIREREPRANTHGPAADPKMTPAVSRQNVTAEATWRSFTAFEGERWPDIVSRVQGSSSKVAVRRVFT